MRKKTSRHVTLLNGVRIKRTLFIRYTCGALLFVGGAIALLYIGFQYDNVSEKKITLLQKTGSADGLLTSSDEESKHPTSETVDAAIEESPLLNALRGHVAALALAKSESIAMKGTYTSANAPFAIAIFAKKPNLYRQSFNLNGFEVDAGYDGKAYWQTPPVKSGADKRSAFNEHLLILECAFTALVWQFEANGLTHLSLEEADVNGKRNLLVLRNDALLPSPVYHHLDAETHLEAFRTALLHADSENIEVEVHYDYVVRSDSQSKTSTYELSGYRMLIDGEVVAVASLNSFESNRGVMPWMFDKPTTSTVSR